MNCDKIREYFMDYIDGSLSCEEQEKVDMHLKNCRSCSEELSYLKQLILDIEVDRDNIEVPVSFIKNLKNRIVPVKTPRIGRKKASIRTIFIAAAILILSMITVFAAQGSILEWIKKINPEIRIKNLVDKGVGERLNISAVDKNIRITITDVAGDDIQTLVQYKIEDLENDREYYVDYINGIEITERWGKAGEISNSSIKMCTSIFSSEGQGTLTLYPIDSDEKTIHLTFKELDFKSGDTIEKVKGNWSFEVPIVKQKSKTYDINQTVRGDGYTIKFNKITISPTLTRLSFDLMGSNEGEWNEGLENLMLIVNGKECKPYNFGHEVWDSYSTIGWGSNEMTFESMYPDKPKNIEIRVKRIQVSVKESKEFIIDLTKSTPQEFEYLGTKITIDNIKVDKDITFDRYEALDNRQYSVLRDNITIMEGLNSEKYFSTWGNYTETFYVDEDGNKYEYYDALSRWEEIRDKNPEFYVTKTNFTLRPSDKLDIKELRSLKMTIEGYSKTKFIDETVKVKLK